MCWNAEISGYTFIFTVFCVGLTYIFDAQKNSILLYVLTFSFIQLIEYILWTNIDEPCINTTISNIGMIILILECYTSINLIHNLRIRNSAFISFSILATICLYTHDYTRSHTVVGHNGHLLWNWTPNTTYTCVYLIYFVGSSYFWNGTLFIRTFSLLTFTISLMYSIIFGGGMGTLWCWISNSSSIYLLYTIWRQSHTNIKH